MSESKAGGLKPCPGCGKSDSPHIEKTADPIVWWVECYFCGFMTKYHRSEFEAMKAWNTRALESDLAAMRKRAKIAEEDADKLAQGLEGIIGPAFSYNDLLGNHLAAVASRPTPEREG